MSVSTKVCPFCMVDAHTDASVCAYCGSSYDRVAPVASHDDNLQRARRRTYNGTPAHNAEALGVNLSAF